jgi:hypothetical protein
MFKDPRTPVSVSYVGRYKITIFDLEAYEQSKVDYPDDPKQPSRTVRTDNSKPTFAKKKSASRYNWIVPIELPLGKVAQEKEVS